MANYQINGGITNILVQSQPDRIFMGQTFYYWFANTTISIRFRTSGGVSGDTTTTLLNFLGDSADMSFLSASGTITRHLNESNVITDRIEIPDFELSVDQSVTESGITFRFRNWIYDNTSAGTSPLASFNIYQPVHRRSLTSVGTLTTGNVTTSINSFYINGYYNISSDYYGSILELFQNYEVAVTENGTTSTRDLWDLLEYGYTITTNKESFSSGLSIGGTNTENTSARTYFSHCDRIGDTTTITLTIPYYDTSNNLEKSLTISFDIYLVGVYSLLVLGLGSFIEQVAKSSMYRETMTLSNGVMLVDDLPSSYEHYYNAVVITFLNTDTTTPYSLGDTLPNGHYQITISLYINPDYILEESDTIEIYQSTPTSISASLINESYRIGSVFQDTQIIVKAQYLVYGSSYYETRLYYPNYTSDYDNHRFINTDYPSVDITVTYGSLTTQVTAYTYFAEVDEIWVYDKKTLAKTNYGEIQQNYNMNFVIDGTKDNTKVTVLNHISEDIKPNTIVYLVSTDTWWIVKEDKVTRYDNEINALWQHDISLVGAIEILNARDLTSCGFNQNHYTIAQFFERLLKLTDFEIDVEIDYGTYVNQTKMIDYIKTFDNYTPLSAIKEMCDGLNVTPKMTFSTNGFITIEKAIISFVPKSGINETPIDISVFDDSEEIVTSDRENYGSKVVSNVQNVTSGKVIRYPAVGTVHISSDANKVTYDSALLRLPTKANYVESLEICGKYVVSIEYTTNVSGWEDGGKVVTSSADCYNDADFETVFAELLDTGSISTAQGNRIRTWLNNNKQLVKEYVNKYGHITLENGAEYIQIDSGNDWAGNWNGKEVQLQFNGNISDQISGHPGIGVNRSNSIGLNDKKHYDVFPQQRCLIYWEQGSDLIKNFRFYDNFTPNQNSYTFPVNCETVVYEGNIYSVGAAYMTLKIVVSTGNVNGSATHGGVNLISSYEATYVVNYIPMTDMKLKVENGLFENDTNLYNQNGTMVSSKAISKLVNSHADSISSNQLTRYKRYYDFFTIPSVGQIVNNNGVYYIINNVSIDFAENDSNSYALDCQFTLTKQIACISTMVGANTNIRDYNTPQDHNIYRIQNYRDYIYFAYSQIEQNSYMPISNLFNIASSYTSNINCGYVDTHTAIMKIQWGTNNINYYQLPCIKYELEKMVVEVIDFKDNNIIGYAVNNTRHPFQVSTWWVETDLIQTPVSYVDDVGHLIGLNIYLCDNEQLTDNYNSLGKSSIYSASCIIPDSVYTYARSNHDAVIDESEYDKDGLEIPMFIYSCQIANNQDILVSSDFLNYCECNENEVFIYSWYITNSRITEENAMGLIPSNSLTYISGDYAITEKTIIPSNSNSSYLDLYFYNDSQFNITTKSQQSLTAYTGSVYSKNIVICRSKLNLDTKEITHEFFMGINNCKINLTNGYLRLYKNAKKL